MATPRHFEWMADPMAGETASPLKCAHLMISGRVQGVSYRVWLQNEARALGVSGWTRNRANGDVEAVFSGSPDAVQTLCELCRAGPPAAHVDRILIDEPEPSALDLMGAQGSFNILPTL